jgi:Xaa-Pro aminopeptidase
VFVFRPGQKPETILFVRPKDELKETWEGFRYGPELAKKYFLIDEAYLITELSHKLPELLKNSQKAYYRLNQFPDWDRVILKCIEDAKNLASRSGRGHMTIVDSAEFLAEFRIYKDPIELEWLKKACQISAEAHIEAMKFIRPGLNERQVQACLEYHFKYKMSPRVAYTPIVASGANACTLHYVYNDQECRDGDLLLIDAGAEFNYMNGDVTRTFPVNGKFSPIQKEFYNHVLRVQKEILNMIKPGVPFNSLQNRTAELLTEAMIDLKLLKGSVTDLVRTLAYKKYYPHGVSHWLGMDTHDAGLYQINGESRKLETNMCFTVEPGLYVPLTDESAPKELRGLGVRIEDDVCVTENGHFNMTDLAPKDTADIEKIIAV